MPKPMPIAYATGGVHCTLHRTTFYLSVPNPTLLANSMPYSLVHYAQCPSALYILMTENGAFEHLNKVRLSNFVTRAGG